MNTYIQNDGTTIFRNVGSYSPTRVTSQQTCILRFLMLQVPRSKHCSFQSCYCAGGYSLRETQRLAYTICL